MGSGGLYTKLQQLQGVSVITDLSGYNDTVRQINQLEGSLKNASDYKLQEISKELKRKATEGVSPEALLIDAYALVREVCSRQLKMRPFDVQLLTAIILNEEKISEMQTGEGKTLAAVMPAYLNALSGKGVHILTFNDYLAKRDANWMRPVYEFLGLSVGHVGEGMKAEEKKKAYHCDITYATAKEVGFDFLRSFIAYDKNEIVIRNFNYAIVDEADAILIDEARNPLVLSGNLEATKLDFYSIAAEVAKLTIEEDYSMDEYSRNIYLTDHGINKIQKVFAIENLHEPKNYRLLSAVNLAMHAKQLLFKDIDYVIKQGEIKLIDEFTGRIVEDRKWPHGLQTAVEAKERLEIKSEGITLGSISIQHFILRYPKLAGMTGTARQAAEEFKGFYGLDVAVVPPNRPCIRKDLPDVVFADKDSKLEYLLSEIETIHKKGRPLLIGTLTVLESEELGTALSMRNINHQILNAKNDELEAEIIANAGAPGAVTISTNMAGRGTDIVLGGKDGTASQRVKDMGGLHIIATNKHESARIDKQLIGRAGRQGDPGSSQFIISFEDSLMVKYKLKEILPAKFRDLKQKEAISNIRVNKRIAQAQRIIEGQMYDIRINLVEYTSFIEKQRIIFNGERNDLLLFNQFNEKLSTDTELINFLSKSGNPLQAALIKEFIMNQYDNLWATHLDYISELREGIHLVRLGGESPIAIFQKKADENFKDIMEEINQVIIELKKNNFNIIDKTIKKPASTWTYIVNDNPFGNQLGIMLLDKSNIGMQVDFFSAVAVFFAGVFKRRKD